MADKNALVKVLDRLWWLFSWFMRHSTRAQQCYGTQVAVRSGGCLLTIARNWQTAAIVGSPSSRRQRRHSTMGPKACLKFEVFCPPKISRDSYTRCPLAKFVESDPPDVLFGKSRSFFWISSLLFSPSHYLVHLILYWQLSSKVWLNIF